MCLELDGISVRLGDEPIFDGLDLAIKESGLTAIMGPSGIGKTTLLRLIAGLIKPHAGTRRCEAKVAIIFQDPRLLPWQSAVENAGFGLRASGIAPELARLQAAEMLARLGLSPDDQMKRPSALSGGMRQRVGIARALAIKPGLLLMDEPFTGLDIGLRQDLQVLVRALIDEQRLTAILVTHDPIEAMTLSDRVIILGGRPAKPLCDLPISPRATSPADAYAAAADLMRRPEVAAAFDRRARG